jgi:stearoyl-CoA desaturase (delta-9 desaturase)
MNLATNDPSISDFTVALMPPPETVPPPNAEAEAYSKKEINPWMPPRFMRWSNGLDWPAVIWMGLIHLGALAAIFFFTWKALGLFLLLSWITGGLGVCLGYHRLLTHWSFKTFPWMRRSLAMLGTLSGEGPPITWVGVHRMHHRHSDKEGDPHSPQDGGWWSHILWLFPRPRDPAWRQMRDYYSKDLIKDPFMRMLDKTFILWHFVLGGILLAAGWYFWDIYTGLSFLTWGLFLRMVWVMHITWCVNSASHIWGYRNYETKDNSRNLWWVGLLAYGEGWHNNHHAFPGRARHGHRWWEIDATYATICLMEKLGLAWNVLRAKK